MSLLDDIHGQDGITATYHLGDLVGYAPWPDETVSLLKASGIEGIAGNYDSTVATDYKHCGCKYEDARRTEVLQAWVASQGLDSFAPATRWEFVAEETLKMSAEAFFIGAFLLALRKVAGRTPTRRAPASAATQPA